MTEPAPDPTEPSDRADPVPEEAEVVADRERSRRSVSFILAVVAAALVVMVGLALWVVAVPYDVSAPLPGAGAVACDTGPTGAEADRDSWQAACDRAEDEARGDRRNTALVIGFVAFVVATAVSTWPSRRLTGERLGPLR